MQRRLAYHSDHPVQHKGHGGVVRAIEEWRHSVILPSLKPLFQTSKTLSVQSPHWLHRKERTVRSGNTQRSRNTSANLGEVPVHAGVSEVKLIGVIVCQYPWKHGVLVQVNVGPSCNGVEVHEVVEVGDLSSLPFCSHGGLPKQLLGSR